jgi:hypothetical protein
MHGGVTGKAREGLPMSIEEIISDNIKKMPKIIGAHSYKRADEKSVLRVPASFRSARCLMLGA